MKPVGRTAKFSKMTLEAAYGREMNIQFSGNSTAFIFLFSVVIQTLENLKLR